MELLSTILPYIYMLFWTLTFCIFCFFIFIKIKEYGVNKKEEIIKQLFIQRTALIPSVYEISKDFLTKHEDIFDEALKLRMREFWEDSRSNSLYKIMPTKKLIQHEINFIFKVCNKHKKLIREWKFIYLRNELMEKSRIISQEVDLYQEKSKGFNKLIQIKNSTIIGYLFPVMKKLEL